MAVAMHIFVRREMRVRIVIEGSIVNVVDRY